MELTVVDKTAVAAGTVRIAFAHPAGEVLPPFAPGAHLELHFAGLVRRYSLVSSPGALQRYAICVLRTDPSRGGSAYLHEKLAVGDRVAVEGPFNAFPLDTAAEHSVFIAGGIGITPFVTMTEALAAAGRTFELHYAARSPDRFVPLPELPGRVRHYVDEGGRPGLDGDAVLDAAPDGAPVYVCGPRPLIEAVRAAAARRGWPDERVRFESFGAAAKPGDGPVEVHLAMSGMTLTVEPGQTILEALLQNGVWAPHECRRGECASCATEVLDGEVDHRDLCLSEDQRAVLMCTCISWARSPRLTLNL